MMMEALIYGVTDIAKMVALLRPPPENTFMYPSMVPDTESKYCDSSAVSINGTGIEEPKRNRTSTNTV